ncbi:MAG: hypothetical protein HYZ11_11940 [Candidatus Tectomicrobia bacterium]|uniref:Uncharacterized protein n=1 Tax=Tectimicrobiota bacterium TaxID=2528274 RepID=A0A932MNZ9_UNCTE|nr:hypothetical protein [Candidatus Tectomicrobia bacterium]
MTQKGQFGKNVFINCPFDDDYIPLLRPLLFTVLYCGLTPRITSESFDSGETRLNSICKLISNSKFSIHDLSRLRARKAKEFHRMNMPFELGVDLGCRRFGNGALRRKRFLILDEHRYRYQKALSDISGSDIKHHTKNPRNIVRQARNWFVENGLAGTPSGQAIWLEFNEFMADFYEKRRRDGYSRKELQIMPIPELISFMRRWIASHDL